VVDAWRGNYTPTELCQRVVRSCKRHQTGDLTIENTPGCDYLIAHIQNEAIRQNWSLRIDRPEFQNDDSARIGRMKQLEPMMRSGRLWVAKDTGQSEEIQNQFTNFGMVEQNGLIDTISRLALRMSISILQGEITEEQKAMYEKAQSLGAWGMIYGQGGAVQMEEAIQAAKMRAMKPSNSYGLPNMLGGLDG
jgi:hypothetical protein